MGCVGEIEVGGAAPGSGFSPVKRQKIVGNRQRETLPLPKRGSSVQALIEFVVRFRLGEGIARKSLCIE